MNCSSGFESRGDLLHCGDAVHSGVRGLVAFIGPLSRLGGRLGVLSLAAVVVAGRGVLHAAPDDGAHVRAIVGAGLLALAVVVRPANLLAALGDGGVLDALAAALLPALAALGVLVLGLLELPHLELALLVALAVPVVAGGESPRRRRLVSPAGAAGGVPHLIWQSLSAFCRASPWDIPPFM